ncbi:MAG: AraC family transcriptional regulator [Pseudomonadota bacterium]
MGLDAAACRTYAQIYVLAGEGVAALGTAFMQSFDSVLDIPRYRNAVKWQGKAGTAQLGVRRMVFEPGAITSPGVDYSALVLYRRPAQIRHNIAGDDRGTRQFMPGDLMLRAEGLNYTAEYVDHVDVNIFALDSRMVQSATANFNADVPEVFGRLEARPFRSALIEGLATRLSDEVVDVGDRLYADSLLFAMIHELWRLATESGAVRDADPDTLCPVVLRRIDEAVADAPAGQISLDSLAELTGLPMPAFSAAMKRTTGQTPYQYVLTRRVAVARDLIETTGQSLAEIAFNCGFSSQSHMTDVFRAKLGITPGRLRAAKG